MRKWNMMLLALLLVLLPATGMAQDLPDFLSAVYTGVGEGLQEGAMLAMAAMDQELTLELLPQSDRIEEGKTICLTIKAGNPRPQAADVKIMLNLPERLSSVPDMSWEAKLPEATYDPQTGTLTPSETVFTREITLSGGGRSEAAEITAEMSMGSRFYKAKTGLALCVPDVSATAETADVKNGRVQPGDAFSYLVTIENAGAAAKDAAVELTLPHGVTVQDALPEGFVQEKSIVRGVAAMQAAAAEANSMQLRFPVIVNHDALEGDQDARRLLAGSLKVDGKRVALPRVEVCGAKISAALTTDQENIEAGEMAMLSAVVVNTGLAPANVKLSCVLPQGLTLQENGKNQEDKNKNKDRDKDKAAALPSGGDDHGAAIPSVVAQEVTKTLENRTLVFDIHMDAAEETAGGVIANTQVMEIPVKASVPQESLSEALLGATLAWSVDEAPAKLGEAVAMRVYQPEFLGLSADEWNGVFWASVLMLAAVACLYAAARRDAKAEDFCCE